MAQQSILVIEDEILWHKLLARILGAAGYTVYIATTCTDGIKLAERYKPDCIVSDFHLPDGDAVLVCSAIRANENIKSPPVIIFSSDPAAEISANEECHANAFILKGQAAVEELPATIKRILRPVFSVQPDV